MQEFQCGCSLDVLWVSRKGCRSQIMKGFACHGKKLDFIQSYKACIKLEDL